jgi:hypothetical protein
MESEISFTDETIEKTIVPEEFIRQNSSRPTTARFYGRNFRRVQQVDLNQEV